MAFPTLLRELTYGASHLLFPRLCEGCREPLLRQEEVLCLSCLAALPRTRFHHRADNEAALRLAGRVAYEQATAFCYFSNGGLLQHLLHRLKYAGRKNIGTYLGTQAALDLLETTWMGDINVIVPVPLHPKKERLRGYNQSVWIAKGMARLLQVPLAEKALRRTRHTESQTQKNREERIHNVRGAFEANGAVLPPEAHVLLVDDVLTTGATLEAASAALCSISHLRVSVCTIGLAGF
ncbi:MAG: ComF family protein [Bacteroidetes bacterium]|nr:ComF family protein [Bacteroidota bacterium]MBS1630453.1 ComF family protein [Bacteroidota bacterium]